MSEREKRLSLHSSQDELIIKWFVVFMKTLTITKRKLSHSALPFYFLRIECYGTFMEAPKHEKEEKKKTVQPPGVPGALQLKGLEVK